jgi:sugar lactone lactonase YvrE
MARLVPADRIADLALDIQAELGEGPVWDPASSCLYLVDILRGLVHRFDPATQGLRTYEVGRSVGAVALTERGDLVLAVRDGFARVDLSSGGVEMIARVITTEADKIDRRMNDGSCDAAGRFWAGTMALDERAGAGALYCLDRDGRVEKMVDRVSISNGIGWSGDGRLMYYIDSLTQSVDVFDFDLASGTIANRRSFVIIDPVDGTPDGLTLDAEGFVWVALWGGSAVRRYAPDGTLDSIVRVPTTYVTSCAFGGPDLGDLFITTARIKLSEAERTAEPLAGGVFRARPGVRGRPPHRFKG